MTAFDNDSHAISGGCLCAAVRYTSHICQCTQCRKHSGSLVAHFITVNPSQLQWSNASNGNEKPQSFKEFSSSKGVYRGFCSSCGSALTWRSEGQADEVEIMLGTVDETYLIGDRTEKVTSQSLTNKANFEKVLDSDEGALGREMCMPAAGQMYVRNAIKGVTDRRKVLIEGAMGKYSTSPEWEDIAPIPQNDGGPNPLAAIAYTEEYSEAMGYLRAVMAANEKSERVLELTEHIISMNPAHYTVWLYRANTLFDLQKQNQSNLEEDILEELKWLDGVSLKHLKNYQI
ncbi:MAG: hypothetical protein Q9174_005180, partial [Haloplaca sp. 1 TL-2023]